MPATATATETVETPEVETPSRLSNITSSLMMLLAMTWLTIRSGFTRLKTGESQEVPMSNLMRIMVSLTIVLVSMGAGVAMFAYLPYQYGLGVMCLILAVGEIKRLPSLSVVWRLGSSVRKVAMRVAIICLVFALGVATMRYSNAMTFGLLCGFVWLAQGRLLGLEAATELAETEYHEDDEV